MEGKFKRQIESLENISHFISQFITTNKIDDSLAFSINLIVEELFTNMVKYNTESSNDISISLKKDDRKLIIRLVDFGVKPFDVTKTGEVDTHQALEDRKVGGLGIHLVKRLVDKIDYEYSDGQSRITLVKNL